MTKLIKLEGNQFINKLPEIVKKNNPTICKAKNCNNTLEPSWLSRIDKRYCKDCLD